MASAYFKGKFYSTTPNACVVDITPPVFAGIANATAQTDGSIEVDWLPALDSTPPIEYVLYIALGSVSAATLFVNGNIVAIAPELSSSFKIYTLSDQSTYLVNGQVYTLGVRAKDGVGNIDSNLTIQTETAIASGNMPAIYQTIANQLQATEVLLAADHVNFQTDHSNFQSDHTNFQTDHANFQGDHTNFQTDHSNFVSDLSTFNSHNNDLSTQVNLLTTEVNDLTVITNTLAGSGGLIAEFEEHEDLTALFEEIEELI